MNEKILLLSHLVRRPIVRSSPWVVGGVVVFMFSFIFLLVAGNIDLSLTGTHWSQRSSDLLYLLLW